MFKRHIDNLIKYSIEHFPCSIITGPRQIGKTTLLTNQFLNESFSYVSLDDTSEKLLAKNNPKQFLAIHPFPLIIDEVQKAPELFPEIEFLIEQKKKKEGSRSINGMFILSGSSRKNILDEARESLSGRASIINMSSFSLREINDEKFSKLSFNIECLIKNKPKYIFDEDKTLEYIFNGSLPALYDDKGLRTPLFYSSYISTYMEKDIKDEIELKDEIKFYNLLKLIASLTGQELNYDSLSKNIGVSSNTIKSWVSLMSKTGIIRLLQPYNEYSWSKRIVKRPKIYFFDTGLVCYLLGIENPSSLKSSFLKGALFETLVVNEIFKSFGNQGKNLESIFYYRDNNQKEIDLVILEDSNIYGLECKFQPNIFDKNTKCFTVLKESKFKNPYNYVISLNNKITYIDKETILLPFFYI